MQPTSLPSLRSGKAAANAERWASKKKTMNKLEEAIVAMRVEAIESAERRLSRKLTDAERAGIQSISSGMMLETVCQSFSFGKYSVVQIEADLAHFASKAKA